MFDEIIDHHTDGSETKQEDACITSHNGSRRRRETTKGREILVQRKVGSTMWEKLKYMKEYHPVQTCEYAVQYQISKEPVFAWWLSHIITKRE